MVPLLVTIGCAVPLAPWEQSDTTRLHAYSGRAEPGVVGSREYKLPLDPQVFADDEAFARAVIWGDVVSLAERLDLDTDHDLDTLAKERSIRFYDVPGSCDLRQRGFVFRERVGAEGREATVKYRSPDRYLAAGKRMQADGGRTKLEEDISAPFASKFSHSTTLPLDADKNLNKLDDPLRLVPGVADHFDDLDDQLPLAIVGDATYQERVYGPAEVDLGPLDAELSLTLWADGEQLVIAELSFKVEAEDEGFDERSSARALWLFEQLQEHPYVDLTATTKTASAYARDPGFCTAP